MVTRNGGRSQVAELGSHQPPRPMRLCLAWIPLSHHSVSYPPTYTPWLFPGSLYFLVAPVVKNLPANAGDLRDTGSIPGLGRSPGEGHGNPLQHSCLENSMDRGAWRATVLGVARNQTRLSNWAHTHVFLAIIGVLVAQSCPNLRSHGHRSPWNSPDKNTGVGCHSLLQGIFPDHGLLHCRQIVYRQ